MHQRAQRALALGVGGAALVQMTLLVLLCFVAAVADLAVALKAASLVAAVLASPCIAARTMVA